MKLAKIKKEKIQNIILILSLIGIVMGVIFYIWHDKRKIEQHKQECIKLCHPKEVVDILSSSICVCKAGLDLKDTI